MINFEQINDYMYQKVPRDLGIYIHIPFCVRKCNYCDFLSAPATEEIKKQYVEALITEIESYKGRNDDFIVPTVFIGGGTPSCIDEKDIINIMDTVGRVFHLDRERLEATIEINPGTLNESKLQAYKEAGINRLSFGLQSADDTELRLLGRLHNYRQFEENYLLARKAGFHNINIDLMSALPGQTLQSWEITLRSVLGLNPEHISAYSLIIEEGTGFYEHYKEDGDRYHELPDEEMDRLIYHRTKELLREHGYERYEISNYAKSGYKCAHNCTYWNGTEYLGFGLGASSLLNGARFKNMHDIKQYIQLCAEFKQNALSEKIEKTVESDEDTKFINPIGLVMEYDHLAVRQRIEEYLFLGLRLSAGISKSAFFQRFQIDIDSIYHNVFLKLINQKLLTVTSDRINLTDLGIDISNVVLSDFLLD